MQPAGTIHRGGVNVSEQRFEYRIQKILERKGYLVVNCARSKPFDLVAIIAQTAFPLEIKAKNTRYPNEQINKQMDLCKRANTCFFVIEQSKAKGKIKLYTFGARNPCRLIMKKLEQDLEEYLE